jgi:hypothetical protein
MDNQQVTTFMPAGYGLMTSSVLQKHLLKPLVDAIGVRYIRPFAVQCMF